MNNQSKTILFIITFCSLLILSAGYVVPLQNWVVFNSSFERNHNNQLVDACLGCSGIRTMVSSKAPVAIYSDAVQPPAFEASDNPDKIPTLQNRPVNMNLYESEELSLPRRVYFEPTQNSHVEENISQPDRPFIAELSDEILVEMSAQYSIKEQQRILTRLLVLPNFMKSEDLLSTRAVDTKQKPYLFKRVLNQYQKPIRYPAQAYRYAEFLLKNNQQQISDEEGRFVVINIPLHNHNLPDHIKSYQAWVNQYAHQFKVSPELVFAIMDVESAFNPNAVSRSNALGLMQIKAKSAGKDVYKLIDGIEGEPSEQSLFDPQENIRVGSAYLGLLKYNYLQDVRNPKNKEMLTISAYNGGLSSVLKLFGKTPNEAIARINKLHPKQLYRTLRYSHQSDETKRYIEKVMQAKNRYNELLDLAA